jgi:hypothetical protein
MTAEVIRFPTRRVVRGRLAIGSTPERELILSRLRSVDGAIAALRRQHKSLVMQYRAAIEREPRAAD